MNRPVEGTGRYKEEAGRKNGQVSGTEKEQDGREYRTIDGTDS
jgi:hypothetical protein